MQPAVLVPDPVGRQSVDDSVDKGEHDVRVEVGSFRHRTRHDGGGRAGEAGVEKELGVLVA